MNKEDKEKFVERIQNMIYYICGCNKEETEELLLECLKLNKTRKWKK